MATEIKLPELAEGIEKGEVVSVMVSEGDAIDVDTPLIEVESEKATLPVPSTIKGTVSKLMVKQGDTISVGQTILQVEEGEGGADKESDEGGEEEAEEPKTEKKKAPEKKKAKAKAATAKPESGEEDEEEAEEEDGGGDGETEEAVEESAEGMEKTKEPAKSTNGRRHAPAEQTRAPGEAIPAGPAVRRIARELGLDLGIVQGSGRNGRIIVEDLDPHIKGYISKRGGGAGGAGVPAIELPDFSQFGKIRRERADSLRRKIAERMAQNWSSVPHVHQFADADITELMALMKRYKDRAKEAGGQLTFTVFALKAAALALKEFPQFNVSYDPVSQEIIYKEYIHIGVAVDTPKGLIVPVIRDADQKPLLELAKELGELAEKTRERKTSLDDLRGGSFTISNLGGIGGAHFTPIINAPEAAILGIGRAQRRPMFDKDGQVVARDICPLCVGYDHRIIDGADGARFTVRLVEIFENFEAAFLGF